MDRNSGDIFTQSPAVRPISIHICIDLCISIFVQCNEIKGCTYDKMTTPIHCRVDAFKETNRSRFKKLKKKNSIDVIGVLEYYEPSQKIFKKRFL